MKLDLSEEIQKIYESHVGVLKEHGIDMVNDEFKVVQPYDDGNAITLEVGDDAETGKRTLKVEVSDTLFILPKKEGTLDVFGG